MTGVVLGALISHWRRQPFQLATLIIGLALATALWTGVQAINAEARKSYAASADVLSGGGLAEFVRPDGGPIDMETFAALRRAGWLVSPVIDGWLSADRGRVRLLAVDPLTLPAGTASDAVGHVDVTDFFGRGGVILAAPDTAARLDAYGSRVRAVPDMTAGFAITDLAAAEDLTGLRDATRLLVLPDQPLMQEPLENLGLELEYRVPDTAAELGRLTDSFHLNLTAFGLLSFAVGLFIVNGAIGLAFEQRRGMYRTLRALGVTARRLVLTLVAELLILALVSGTIGVALGYVIAAALLPDVAATLRGLYGAPVEGTLALSTSWWVTGLVIAVAGTATAAATNLWQTARLSPLAAAKPRAWSMASNQTTKVQAVLACGCMIAALAGWGVGGLLGGFILLGGILLAAALVLPILLASLLALAARRARRPLSEWFWADTRQQLPGLSLALMALLLALATNIGVGTMVSSFRMTFTGWLDQRLASELYVSVDEREDAMLEFLAPIVDAVLPIWRVEAEVLGAPGEIFGVVDHATYRENWPILNAHSDVWNRLASGEGALINEQLARREDLGAGDTLRLPGGWATEVTGIYSDYGNPLGQVIIPQSTLIARYPDAERGSYGIRVPLEQVESVRRALVDDFGLPGDRIVDQAALKDMSLRVFERTFAVTGALNVLTLAVAGFAILTSLLTLASMRVPQVAPIWALGVTRAQLGWMEFSRSIMLALLTFVLSIPLGIGLAWVLLNVINVEAFGWKLPLKLFPADWAILGVLSIVAAALASLLPARHLSTRPPADLLKVFAHER